MVMAIDTIELLDEGKYSEFWSMFFKANLLEVCAGRQLTALQQYRCISIRTFTSNSDLFQII